MSLRTDHPDTLTVWNNLAGSYWSAGRTGDAITILERVVSDMSRNGHPDAATASEVLDEWRKSGGSGP